MNLLNESDDGEEVPRQLRLHVMVKTMNNALNEKMLIQLLPHALVSSKNSAQNADDNTPLQRFLFAQRRMNQFESVG